LVAQRAGGVEIGFVGLLRDRVGAGLLAGREDLVAVARHLGGDGHVLLGFLQLRRVGIDLLAHLHGLGLHAGLVVAAFLHDLLGHLHHALHVLRPGCGRGLTLLHAGGLLGIGLVHAAEAGGFLGDHLGLDLVAIVD